MSQIRTSQKLNSAPIVEALVQFKFSGREEISDSLLNKFASDTGWPKIEEIQQITVTKSLAKDAKKEDKTASSLYAYRIRNGDNSKVIVAGKDSFTLSYLGKTYRDWKPFLEEFKGHWKSFAGQVGVTNVSRVGVRFINKIPILTRLDLMGDFFKPSIPKLHGLQDSIPDEFLIRLVKAAPSIDGKIIISYAANPQVSADSPAFLYDIDVYSEKNHKVDDESLWQKLEKVRAIKNNLFFESFTDKGLEILNGK